MGTVNSQDGRKKQSLRSKFAGAILGTMTAIGTVTGMMQGAQAQGLTIEQTRVNDFVFTNDRLRAQPDNPYYDNRQRDISNLYAALHDAALLYMDKPGNGNMTFLNDIGLLGNTYGLLRGGSYNQLLNMIDVHSSYADAYRIGMQMQGGNDFLPDSGGFTRMKALALEGVGTALATYIEDVYNQVQRAGGFSTQNAYNSFDRVCRFHKALIEEYASLGLPNVQRQQNRYTIEDRQGRSIVCPSQQR